MEAKIYRPAKNVMQSGRARTECWILEYELETPRVVGGVMGWTGSGDALNQVKMKFATLDQAIAFAEKEGWEYCILPFQERRVVSKNYVDNFKYRPDESASNA